MAEVKLTEAQERALRAVAANDVIFFEPVGRISGLWIFDPVDRARLAEFGEDVRITTLVNPLVDLGYAGLGPVPDRPGKFRRAVLTSTGRAWLDAHPKDG